MAEKLSFELVADDRVSESTTKAGRALQAMANQVEAAQLRVERATNQVNAAVEKYGRESLTAREAANKLAQAEDKAAAAAEKHAAAQKQAQAETERSTASSEHLSQTTEQSTGRMEKLRGGVMGMKVSMVDAWASLQMFSGALQFTQRVVTEGLQQGLIRANAQVTLGAEGYRKFAAQATITANSLGLTSGEFLNSAGQAALLAKNMGFGQDTAVKFGSTLPDLASKLSLLSSGTRDASESSDMLRSALAGEFDPLQAVGINISANIVAMKAQAIQAANNGKLSTQQANALAVLQIVQEQTTTATGVLSTEQGKQAQKVAATTAQWRDQAQQIEQFVAPKIVNALDAVWKFDQKFMAGLMHPGQVSDYSKVIDDENAAASAASVAQKGLASVIDQTTKKTAQATWTTKDYTDALDSNKNMLLQVRGGETGYWASVDEATKSVQENGRTLDVHTQKGRANRQALDQQASAAMGYLQALQASNAPAAQFNAKLDEARARLLATAVRMGMTRGEARAYAAQLLGIPHQVATGVALNAAGAISQLNQVQVRLDRINGRVARAVVVTDYQGSVAVPRGVVGMRAEGGPVRAGMPYVVGEKRAELFVPETNGTILPRADGARSGGGGGGVVVNVYPQQVLASPRDIVAAVSQAFAATSAQGSMTGRTMREAIGAAAR